MNNKGVSYWAIIIVLAFFVVALIVAFWPQDKSVEDNLGPGYARFLQDVKQKAEKINEKAKIEKWLVENKLNEYGDPMNTMYAGGTPLFDESTGETTDRYEYIMKKYPNRPWNK